MLGRMLLLLLLLPSSLLLTSSAHAGVGALLPGDLGAEDGLGLLQSRSTALHSRTELPARRSALPRSLKRSRARGAPPPAALQSNASLRRVAGGAARTVTLGHFLTQPINRRYIESSEQVNGRETYWSEDSALFLYWCTWQRSWIVFTTDRFTSIQAGGACDYMARGPADADILEPACRGGWSEWNYTALELLPDAGVDVVSTEAELQKGFGALSMGQTLPNECAALLLQHGAREQHPRCNDCWSQTAVQLVEMHICAVSDKNFTGRSAQLSVVYVTSCAAEAFAGADGCAEEGGDLLEALRWIGAHGVPTGGSSGGGFTCVPGVVRGLSEPPPCPTECTNVFKDYPRSLQEDLFKPEGMRESWATSAVESAAKALKAGPIGIAFQVFEDFFDYKDGTYVPRYGEFAGYHACVVFGMEGEIFMAINSWGNTNWGSGGMFNISREAIEEYYIPGNVGSYGAERLYPLPHSQHPEMITLAGFENELLNGDYIWGGASVLSVPTAGTLQRYLFRNFHGEASFPPPEDTCLLYYCNAETEWMVTCTRDAMATMLSTQVCLWDAHSPTWESNPDPTRMLGHTEFRMGWYERPIGSSGEGVLKPDAGVYSLQH